MWNVLFVFVVIWAVVATALAIACRIAWGEREYELDMLRQSVPVVDPQVAELQQKLTALQAHNDGLSRQIARAVDDYADLHQKHEEQRIRADRLKMRLQHIAEHASTKGE